MDVQPHILLQALSEETKPEIAAMKDNAAPHAGFMTYGRDCHSYMQTIVIVLYIPHVKDIEVAHMGAYSLLSRENYTQCGGPFLINPYIKHLIRLVDTENTETEWTLKVSSQYLQTLGTYTLVHQHNEIVQ